MEDKNITWMRAFACIMVVSIHVCGYWYSVPNSPVRLMSLIGMGFSRPAVPIFAMISGYLMFREGKTPSFSFAVKRFLTVFIPLAYFGTLFYFYDRLTGRAAYPYWEIFFLVKNHTPLWYLFSLLPIYTVASYIGLPTGKDRPFYRGMFIVLAVLFFLTQSIAGVPFYKQSDYISNPIFFYMVLGFILGQHKTEKPLLNYLGYTALSIAIVYLEWLSEDRLEIYHGYSTILVFFQSIFFFRWAKSLNTQTIKKPLIDNVLSFTAKYSVGIFGWHFMLIPVVKVFWESFPMRESIQLVLSYFSVLGLSLLISTGDKALWKQVRRLSSPFTGKIKELLKKYSLPYIH